MPPATGLVPVVTAPAPKIPEPWLSAAVTAQTCIHGLFEVQAARTPDAIALALGDETLSYAALNERANRLAHHLLSLGVGREERIAVGVNRSFELAVALLAILKAGGAYMPLDPEAPTDRLRFMLRDGGVRIFIGTPDSAGQEVEAQVLHHVRLDRRAAAFAHLPSSNPDVSVAIDQSAYVCFTSGSTGVPKGVDVLHAGVIRLLVDVSYVRLGPRSVVLHAAPAAFDATTFELWGPLLNGGSVALLAEPIPSARSLRQAIARHGITTAFLTTALVNAVVDEDPRAVAGLEQLLFGGEAVSVRHVARLQRACPDLELIHCYGPTETTTFATAYRIPGPLDPGQATISIGRPIDNTTAHVLDEDRSPVEVGEVGELFIGGPGVARGYIGRPELTSERFVADPFSKLSGARLYRTGDMVRRSAEGLLEFVGRRDHQVKIRGHRIELGEIEARLMAQPDVREAVVVCRELGGPGDKRLVAYLVPDVGAGQRLDVVDLKQRLRVELPEYMVPQHTVTLERFPLTPNGKIDRASLPPPDLDAQPRSRPYVAPRHAVERALAPLFAGVLGLDRIGVEDDFFELGGDSLSAVRLLAKVRDAHAVEIPIPSFFARPTIAAIALVIEAREYLRTGLVHARAEGEREEHWL